ncbi:MAG: T9SS type A sorting domain-containing protein [Bacteroidetes bacterium]|nr:T9SS type A sorting domain-containing protein [Bacteroidota bacterium]
MKTFLIIFFSFFISISSFAQNGWVQVPSGTTKSLSKAFFINSSTGWICGDSGLVMKTTNKGLSWAHHSLLTRDRLYDVFFIDTNTGWICGGYYETFGSPANKMYLAKTTNGGLNWTTLLDDTDWLNNLRHIYFFDTNNGLAFGVGSSGSGITSILRKTTNNGVNWSYQPYPAINSLAKGVNGTFWSSSKYWDDTGGDTSYIIYSTNNGTNWLVSKKAARNNFTSTDVVENNIVKTLSSTSAFPYKYYILTSTDNGVNWDSVRIFSYAYDMDFVNKNTGWICGAGIKKTTNGGFNWTAQIDSGTYYFTKIFMRDSLNGLAFASGNRIFITATGGVMDVRQSSNEFANSFSLSQNYPNPFNPATVISYRLPVAGSVSLIVYDALGNEVETLVNEKQNSGSYSVDFNAASLPSGIYFYKLVTEKFSETRKMVLVK